jgi:hypothetical protein
MSLRPEREVKPPRTIIANWTTAAGVTFGARLREGAESERLHPRIEDAVQHVGVRAEQLAALRACQGSTW